MNVIKNNNKIIKLESYWRDNKNNKTRDSDGKKFPFPRPQNPWTLQSSFLKKIKRTQIILKKIGNYVEKKSKDCLLCSAKNITKGDYYINNVYWEEGLQHYINSHNIKPSDEFIDLIYKFSKVKEPARIVQIKSGIYRIEDLKYVKMDRNQIMIMDALLRHGGYTKKYVDKNKTYRYSEHSGLIDFGNTGVDKIIISGKTNRVDIGDDEIFLPKNIPDAFDYEYIFHTHPPTPKPGGRAKDGILYEFPSVSDIFHFIDHYNDGTTQGSIVITAEGLYNIRTKSLDNKKIIVDENKLYSELNTVFHKLQKESVDKYGSDFSNKYFYSVIAQDLEYINRINETLEKYNLYIDFFPRTKDESNKWIIDTIYLPIYVHKKIN